ncbi:head-tail connector protein [Tenacibaculum sp. Mcav3-52]|uniref:head-tail connector protein n=1 Tax=Tenacibaculum sp. Mcav3-52 TaxID=2917762 RepID=UPI001EF2A505|nr:head-tail connector protein [Tenacibaculum sp. Mcav3-52]MCG7502388.1 head-tail connector protein [Tenacibaculum sp. Mcav3-52]
MAYFVEVENQQIPEIVSLAVVKEHLKIEPEFTQEDVLIQSYIGAAISYAEGYTGRIIQNVQYEVYGVSFEDVLNFKQQTKISVDSIQYYDENNVLQTLSATSYQLKKIDKFESIVDYVVDELPIVKEQRSDAVKLVVTCGFKKLPKAIKQAVLLLVSDFYEFRSDRPKTYSTSVQNLLGPYKYYATG